MTTNNKMIEDFRSKIKGIFKESTASFNEEDAPAQVETPPSSPDAAADVPVEPEEKVTLNVSLLKSLLDWVHGEEEEEGVEGEEGAEAPAAEAPTAPVTEEEAPVAPEAPAAEAPAEEGEDPGVEAIEIQALVDKVKELAKTKEVLTDEDFGEIVAAAQAAEGEGEGLDGVMDGEGAGAEASAETPVTEEIGKVVPTGVKNDGNKGIGK